MNQLTMHTDSCRYPITVSDGALSQVGERFRLDRRVLILTDSGVPEVYAQTVADACADPHLLTVPPGEKNKCPEQLFRILQTMLDAGFTRQDAVVAVGGGVIGDVGGLAAALYMRGIDFYNVPTTLLAMVDSSVGGKVAIDFCGYKNIVGTFYQPRAVLIDPCVLGTLDTRQYGCGMAEVIKMFATSDAAAFERLENQPDGFPIGERIRAALKVKMAIVEADEREGGLRRVLNFGHTVGHAVESVSADQPHPLLHGECVGIGMLALTDGEVRDRLLRLLRRYDLPTSFTCQSTALRAALMHDKKAASGGIITVRVPHIGQYTMQNERVDSIMESCREVISFQ